LGTAVWARHPQPTQSCPHPPQYAPKCTQAHWSARHTLARSPKQAPAHLEAVDCAVLHAQCSHALAGAILVHHQVHGKVLHCGQEGARHGAVSQAFKVLQLASQVLCAAVCQRAGRPRGCAQRRSLSKAGRPIPHVATRGARTKELDVVLHGLPVERVQHGVARAVRSTRAAVGLATAPKVQGLATKSALVDLAVLSAREGQTWGEWGMAGAPSLLASVRGLRVGRCVGGKHRVKAAA